MHNNIIVLMQWTVVLDKLKHGLNKRSFVDVNVNIVGTSMLISVMLIIHIQIILQIIRNSRQSRRQS